MMINELADKSTGSLEFRLKALEAQLRCTEIQIKETKEELERRKQEVSLGVPSSKRMKRYWNVTEYSFTNILYDEDDEHDMRLFDTLNYFHSKESAEKHAEMLLEWRKALVANAKGEPIDIKVLLPLLPKGWVCMNENCRWVWCKEKPELIDDNWITCCEWNYLIPFDLKPAKDWQNSLMECGL